MSAWPLLVAAGVVAFVGSGIPAHAAKEVFQRTKPHCNVGTIGHVDVAFPPGPFSFFADLQTGANGRASGVAEVDFGGDAAQQYRAVAGMVESDAVGRGFQVAFVLLPAVQSGDLDPAKPLVAIAREDPVAEDCLAWELLGPDVFPDPVRFLAPGVINLIRGPAPAPHAPPMFSLHYPPQQVMIRGTDMLARFRSSILAREDHRAQGFAELALPDLASLRFEPLFAAAQETSETGPVGIIIMMILEGAPFRLDNLFVAAVSRDPAEPDDDIWDLLGSGVQAPVRFEYEAQGRIQVLR